MTPPVICTSSRSIFMRPPAPYPVWRRCKSILICSIEMGKPAGNPSTMQVKEGPWDSPEVRKRSIVGRGIAYRVSSHKFCDMRYAIRNRSGMGFNHALQNVRRGGVHRANRRSLTCPEFKGACALINEHFQAADYAGTALVCVAQKACDGWIIYKVENDCTARQGDIGGQRCLVR